MFYICIYCNICIVLKQFDSSWPCIYIYNKCSKIILFKLKRYSTFFLEIGSFYHSLRVKQLGFTIFESIQVIFWYLEEYQ